MRSDYGDPFKGSSRGEGTPQQLAALSLTSWVRWRFKTKFLAAKFMCIGKRTER